MMKRGHRRSKQSSPTDVSGSASIGDKQKQEDRISQLEQENVALKEVIKDLRCKLENQFHDDNQSGNNNDGLEKLKRDYLMKLTALEDQVTELKRKLECQSQFSTQRKKAEEPIKHLQDEIQLLKAEKVKLQCKIKLESVQSRLSKVSMEKELIQLQKANRKHDYEVQRLLASNERLKMVLQRKTEAALMAAKRLQEMVELRKGTKNAINNPKIQLVEDELEVTNRLHKLCTQYECQLEEMAEEITKLKEEAETLKQENLRSPLKESDTECLPKDLEINELKEQVNSLSFMLGELRLRKDNTFSKDNLQLGSGHSSVVTSVRQNTYQNKAETPKFALVKKVANEKDAVSFCCSCSKKSLCKTSKCICRSSGGNCGASCGCTSMKCTNRDENHTNSNESFQREISGSTGDSSSFIDINAVGGSIPSQGAQLLLNALVEKAAGLAENFGLTMKPLTDIQNKLINLRSKKPSQRKEKL